DKTGDRVRAIEKTELSDIAARYLQRPWLEHGYFEWMIFDALLYAEIVALAVDMKDGAPSSEGYSWDSSFKHKGDLRAMRKEAARVKFGWHVAGWSIVFVLPILIISLVPSSIMGLWGYILAVAWLAINFVWGSIAWLRRQFTPQQKTTWQKGWELW